MKSDSGHVSLKHVPHRQMRHPAMPRPVNFCAQCGATIYVATWSEHFDDTRVRHLWCCDDCGYAFETLVTYPPLPRR
jgi:hypothetical protein